MTSDYRLEFTLSTIDPKGDVDDSRIHSILYVALLEAAAKLGCEILWDEFSNITDELLSTGFPE